MTLIYLLHCNSRYKIGITGDLKGRLKKARNTNAFEVDVIAYEEVSDADTFEKLLHAKYSHCRVLNEWFNLNDHEVNEVVKAFGECESILSAQEVKTKAAGLVDQNSRMAIDFPSFSEWCKQVRKSKSYWKQPNK